MIRRSPFSHDLEKTKITAQVLFDILFSRFLAGGAQKPRAREENDDHRPGAPLSTYSTASVDVKFSSSFPLRSAPSADLLNSLAEMTEKSTEPLTSEEIVRKDM